MFLSDDTEKTRPYLFPRLWETILNSGSFVCTALISKRDRTGPSGQ